MDLAGAQAELTQAEQGMVPYQDPKLFSQIKEQVMNQWSPMLKSTTEDIGRQQGEYLGKFMGMGGQQGTTAADLSPHQVMGKMGQELGTMSGLLQGSTRYADYLGGQANEMAGKAQQYAQWGYQTQADKYARASQRYQMAFQQAEAEKQRQFQAEQAALSRASRGRSSGGMSFPAPQFGGGQPMDIASIRDAARRGEIYVEKGSELEKQLMQYERTKIVDPAVGKLREGLHRFFR